MNINKIKKITWDHTYLYIELNNLDDTNYYIGTDKNPLMYLVEKNKKCIKILITTVFNNQMLDNNLWYIFFKTDNKIEKCIIDSISLNNLDNCGKTFRYGDNLAYAYVVTFSVTENLELTLETTYMLKNLNPTKKHPILESVNFNERIKKRVQIIFKFFLKIIYHILNLFHSKRGNRVLFMSETRTPMSDNLKALDTYFYDYHPEFLVSYSFRKVFRDKKSIIKWLKLISTISKQDYIFIDDYAPIFSFLNLSKKTKLIQVWHAGVGFKLVGYARFGKKGSPHPLESCHRKYDYAIVGSSNLIDVYQEVFGIDKTKIIATGIPRLDNYLNKTAITNFQKKFFQNYPNFKNKKIILFAPTYRGTGQEDANYDMQKLNLNELYEVCGNKYIVIFKFHPFITQRINISEEYKDRLFDFSFYNNINELFYVTDLLITDYSSNIYEYATLNKPMIFYDYDIDVYRVLRGVHNDIVDNSPGKICYTFQELLMAIKNKDYDLEKLKQYRNKNLTLLDNKACERIFDAVIKQ